MLTGSENVDKLYLSLNSPQYFSIYPPINQAIYWVSTGFSVDNIWITVLIMRILILLIEIAGFYFIFKLFRVLGQKDVQSHWYWSNPLVVIEGIGNLHFENNYGLLFGGRLILSSSK